MDVAMAMDWVVGITTLTALELVLGIDNVVLLTILVDRLPEADRPKARNLGLALALIFRLILLSAIAWLSNMTATLLTVGGHDFSLRDLILVIGGLFLLYKATSEIYHFVEHEGPLGEGAKDQAKGAKGALFASIIGQIIAFDLIFSLDSVLTAIGLAKELEIMVIAVVLAAVLMIVFAGAIGRFVSRNPAIKMLALSFLVMIGVLLMAEGFGSHFDRGYIYFGMAFSLLIEVLNARRRKKSKSTL